MYCLTVSLFYLHVCPFREDRKRAKHEKERIHGSFNSLVFTPLLLNILEAGKTMLQNILILWQRDLEILKRSNASVILHKLSRLLSTEEKGFMLDSAIQGAVH